MIYYVIMSHVYLFAPTVLVPLSDTYSFIRKSFIHSLMSWLSRPELVAPPLPLTAAAPARLERLGPDHHGGALQGVVPAAPAEPHDAWGERRERGPG